MEYESPYKLRNIGIDKSPHLIKAINYLSQNLNNMNPDQYLIFIGLVYSLEVKALNIPRTTFYLQLIEKGKKVLEDIKDNTEFVFLF
jgi:hypothetical protein